MIKFPLVYVAGPLTTGSVMHNTREAIRWAEDVQRQGCVAFTPHTSVLWDMISPHPYEFWMEYDFQIIVQCDGLFRWGGESSGADREILFAEEHKIPVFRDLQLLRQWADRYIADSPNV